MFTLISKNVCRCSDVVYRHSVLLRLYTKQRATRNKLVLESCALPAVQLSPAPKTSQFDARMFIHLLLGLNVPEKDTTEKLWNPDKPLHPERRLTIPQVRSRIYEYLSSGKDYQPIPRDRAGRPLDIMAKEQNELPLRTMGDSYVTAVIPLGSDYHLQERYVSFLGNVRNGRLMEDMDLFSVWVCYRHIFNPKAGKNHIPYVVVTLLLDQVDFHPMIATLDADILMSGHVSWTGKTSMETTVWLEQRMGESYRLLGRAVFLMAARDTRTREAAVVNGLSINSEEEKIIFQAGERRRKRRTQLQSDDSVKTPPDAEEQKILHNHYMERLDVYSLYKQGHGYLPQDSVWMRDTQLNNVIFCHPEDRNMHNAVFGGFTMRHAVELSFSTAYVHSNPGTTRQSPKIRHMSYVGFRNPVAVGSLMKMNSQIAYTEDNFLQLMTYAEVHDPVTGMKQISTVFNYTYYSPIPIRKVVPLTYHESMLYIDGRRHYLEMRTRDIAEKHRPTENLVRKILSRDD